VFVSAGAESVGQVQVAQPCAPGVHVVERPRLRGGGVRQVERQSVVVLVGRVPIRHVPEHGRAGRPPWVHVLDRQSDAGLAAEPPNARHEIAGILALPEEGRVHDDHICAEVGGRSARPTQLLPRVGAPDVLSDHQAGSVHAQHRHLVVVDQLADIVDVGAGRIDADHQLDAVVADRGGQLESLRGGSGVDSRAAQAHQRQPLIVRCAAVLGRGTGMLEGPVGLHKPTVLATPRRRRCCG